MPSDLPTFRKPPLIETAISLQFEPIEGLSNAHLGSFWEGMRSEFPKPVDAEPISPQFELFGQDLPRRSNLPRLRLVAKEGASRLQMLSEHGENMVQVQNGRLAFNWRRVNDVAYPRWDSVFPRFEGIYHKLSEFLGSQKLTLPKPNQWEVVYVNHLVKGRDWQTTKEWVNLLPGVVGTPAWLESFSPDTFRCTWAAQMPDSTGRLHIETFSGFTSLDKEAAEVLVLKLTARGPATDSTSGFAGLQLGRRTIVQTFKQLSGEEAHRKWELVE